MKIGEFSRQCGVSVRMLRFYETAGLLMPRRTAQGWREYDAADAVFIGKAAQLNRAGVPLTSTQEDLVGEIARLQQSARLLADLLAARDKAA